MPPTVVLRRGEIGSGLDPIEGGEALHAMLATADPAEILEAKAAVEADMDERGTLPLVVISFEEMDQSRIDEINASSPLIPL